MSRNLNYKGRKMSRFQYATSITNRRRAYQKPAKENIVVPEKMEEPVEPVVIEESALTEEVVIENDVLEPVVEETKKKSTKSKKKKSSESEETRNEEPTVETELI